MDVAPGNRHSLILMVSMVMLIDAMSCIDVFAKLAMTLPVSCIDQWNCGHRQALALVHPLSIELLLHGLA